MCGGANQEKCTVGRSNPEHCHMCGDCYWRANQPSHPTVSIFLVALYTILRKPCSMHKMYSKFVTEPADRECDDLWAGHYVIAPISELTRESERGIQRKIGRGIGKDNIHTEGRREGGRERTETQTNMHVHKPTCSSNSATQLCDTNAHISSIKHTHTHTHTRGTRRTLQ